MPPARPRIVDDARSETSTTYTKDRVVSNVTTTKIKKTANGTISNTSTTSKIGPAANTVGAASANATASSAVDAVQEQPHVS